MKAGCGDSVRATPQQLTPRFACILEETKLYRLASSKLPPSFEWPVTESSWLEKPLLSKAGLDD